MTHQELQNAIGDFQNGSGPWPEGVVAGSYLVDDEIASVGDGSLIPITHNAMAALWNDAALHWILKQDSIEDVVVYSGINGYAVEAYDQDGVITESGVGTTLTEALADVVRRVLDLRQKSEGE
jgi:hypothetical protein